MAEPWRAAVVGVGRMGQSYAAAFETYPDTTLVALVDPSAERAEAACRRFSVPNHFRTVQEMLDSDCNPQIVSVITPGAYFKDAVLACATSPGVRAVQVEKPFGGPLEDADEMCAACEAAGIVFAGGNMQVAMPEVQEMAARIRSGEFGAIIGDPVPLATSQRTSAIGAHLNAALVTGASVHGVGSEYLGGGCQHIAVLRSMTGMEITEVTAWMSPSGGLTIPGLGAVDAVDVPPAPPPLPRSPRPSAARPPASDRALRPHRARMGMGRGSRARLAPTPSPCPPTSGCPEASCARASAAPQA